jgi:predicted AAA+ superfamily ATPase
MKDTRTEKITRRILALEPGEPMTQREIARLAGCSHMTINKIEQTALEKIRKAFEEKGMRNNYGGKVAKYGSRVMRPRDIPSDYVPPVFDEEKYYQDNDFRYSKNFKMYRQLIETILRHTGKLMSIRDIHIALGVHAQVRWTMDALEMAENVLYVPGYVDKWTWFDAKQTVEEKKWNGIVITPPASKIYPSALMEGK